MSVHQNTQRFILLADDDEDDRILFLEAVQDLNNDLIIQTASDGQLLLDVLSQSNSLPELLFLDINMPCKNGFECLKEIRSAAGELSKVKSIMFSTSSSSLHIMLSHKLGADLYAVKPGTFRGLKELLAKVLEYDWNSGPRDLKTFLLS